MGAKGHEAPGRRHKRAQPAAWAATDHVLHGPVGLLKRLFGMGSGAAAAEDGMDGLFCSPDVIRGDGADMMEFETHNVLSKLDFEEV